MIVVLCCCLLPLSSCAGSSLADIGENLSTYTINLTFDDGSKTLLGTQKVEYVNNCDTTLDCVEFNLYPNAFRQGATYSPVALRYFDTAYPNGFSQGKIDILSVSVNGSSVETKVEGTDENILNVPLADELYPDDSVDIEMTFEVLLPNCLHRFGYGDNTYNFGNFYPVACVYENGEFYEENYGCNGDPFYSDMANYEVSLSFDDDFVLATSGEKTSEKIENGQKTVCVSADVVRDFAFVLSRKFSVLSAKAGETTVYYYYYDDENAERSLQTALNAIQTFSDLFGEYPYKTFSVAKTNFIHGGMEYPNLVYISDAVESTSDYLNVIVHETAHQWWYNMVGSNACEYAWLDEGLTEFSTLMFYRYNDGYDVNEQESLNASLSSYILFSEIYKSVYGDFDSTMTRNVNDFSGDMAYTYVTYVKGVLFFDNLEETVGKKNFLKALKLYFKQNKYKNATPDDLISAFEVVTKRNLEGFFSSWVDGKVILQNYN